MPGVVRIFTAADVPGVRGTGLNDPDQPVFVAEGEVTCCVADFLAMVVADTQFHARQAAKQSRIDYEVLEPITDPFDALKPDAPLVHSAETLQSAAVEHPPADHGLLARRRRRARWPRRRTSSTRRFTRSRSRSRSSSRKRALPSPSGTASRCTPTARGRCYDHQQIAKVLKPGSDGRRDRAASPAGARSARKRSCRSRRRRPSPRGCCSGRSRRCSRASSRPSTTSSATR